MTSKNKSSNGAITSYDIFLAQKFREFKILARYSMKQLSEKTKINASTLSSYRSLQNRMPASHLIRIAKALNKNLDDFLEGIELIEDDIEMDKKEKNY